MIILRSKNIMNSKIVEVNSESVTIQITIPFKDSMLNTEVAILEGVNQVGLLATQEALSKFDTNGESIQVAGKKHTSKGKLPKTYQCPFGEFVLSRHVYQGNEGGVTYCPLEYHARILVFSTPRFAKMVGQKYSQMGSRQVQRDLNENHGRYISSTYIQEISNAVGEVATSKSWTYIIDEEPSEVASIGISLDGTCMLLRDDGWRIAMVGSISLYDKAGERLHSSYYAQAPERGKETFYQEFTKEIANVKKLYSNKTCIGLADGAVDNWKFLQSHVDIQVLDFFHASEYLTKVSYAAFKNKDEREAWLKKSCHMLKHEVGGAKMLLKEMKILQKKKMRQEKKEEINKSITYFTNHITQMDYSVYLAQNIPIGSGVIEAACKLIVKQRMCNSGMRWTEEGARNILTLRCFNETDGKWKQFWKKINKWGY